MIIYDGCFADSWGFPQFSQSTHKRCLDFFVKRVQPTSPVLDLFRPEQLTGLKIGRALFVGVHVLVPINGISGLKPERSSLGLLPLGRCVEFS